MDHERREPDPRDRSGRVSGAVERGDGAGLPLGSEARLQAHRHRTNVQVSRRRSGNGFVSAQLIQATNYPRNEEEVGNAIRKSGIPREKIFVTTKVPISNSNYIVLFAL